MGHIVGWMTGAVEVTGRRRSPPIDLPRSTGSGPPLIHRAPTSGEEIAFRPARIPIPTPFAAVPGGRRPIAEHEGVAQLSVEWMCRWRDQPGNAPPPELGFQGSVST